MANQKRNKSLENTYVKKFEHNSNTITIVIIMFVLSIIGLMGLRILDQIYKGTQHINIIRMFGIAIILNVMVLVFLIISFKRIHFSMGPQGPKGNRGSKGYHGNNSTLNSCNKVTSILKSGQKKHNIRKKEVSFARYPAIIDN